MTRSYADSRPDLTRVALIRDLTDEMGRQDRYRNVGLGVRREAARESVDCLLSQPQPEHLS